MSDSYVAVGGRVVASGYVYLTIQNILSTIIGVLGYSFLIRCISRVDFPGYNIQVGEWLNSQQEDFNMVILPKSPVSVLSLYA
jgi:hypothetical protein